MIDYMRKLRDLARNFRKDECGNATLEFVLVFPMFMMFFLMTYENGMLSLRHVMLERGVDLTVRDVRIGRLTQEIKGDELRDAICKRASIIPNCVNQLQLEMIRRDLRDWDAIDASYSCVDRREVSNPVTNFQPGGNNELMIIKVCARFDPLMIGPLALLGTAIATQNAGGAAGGSYALVTTSAFVVEPYQEDDET
ncbi:pilus assembly protein [Loktanella agnita]|uniref:pilus assembly protein n=1 Tax=Loktanella agnita TaxID=287097 RepID=UPI0039881473